MVTGGVPRREDHILKLNPTTHLQKKGPMIQQGGGFLSVCIPQDRVHPGSPGGTYTDPSYLYDLYRRRR